MQVCKLYSAMYCLKKYCKVHFCRIIHVAVSPQKACLTFVEELLLFYEYSFVIFC